MILSAVPVQAQTAEQSPQGSDFFIAPLTEIIGYGRKAPAVGGGFALGAGDGVAIGFRLFYAFAFGAESVNTLELALFMRFYPFGPKADTGLFVQANIGAVMYARENAVSFPAQAGSISAGLAAGWRFPFGNRWYIEPAVRTGYPYIFGAGVSAGFRP